MHSWLPNEAMPQLIRTSFSVHRAIVVFVLFKNSRYLELRIAEYRLDF